MVHGDTFDLLQRQQVAPKPSAGSLVEGGRQLEQVPEILRGWEGSRSVEGLQVAESLREEQDVIDCVEWQVVEVVANPQSFRAIDS